MYKCYSDTEEVCSSRCIQNPTYRFFVFLCQSVLLNGIIVKHKMFLLLTHQSVIHIPWRYTPTQINSNTGFCYCLNRKTTKHCTTYQTICKFINYLFFPNFLLLTAKLTNNTQAQIEINYVQQARLLQRCKVLSHIGTYVLRLESTFSMFINRSKIMTT